MDDLPAASVPTELGESGVAKLNNLVVDVFARDLRQGQSRLATSCVMVFVALDAPDGKPTAVPSWLPRDADERRLQSSAQELLALSRGMEQLVGTRDVQSV